MSTSATTTRHETAADLVDALGGIPLSRILIDPPPGTATEEDLVRVGSSKLTGVLCELVDGTLVAKDVVPDPSEGGWPETLQHLVDRLGGIPLDRIRLDPPLGTATEEDLVCTRMVELVDGILVDKAMGYFEARVATILSWFLETFLTDHDVGYVVGSDGLVRFGEQRREPDAALYRWERTANRVVEPERVSSITPNLAVEVLSPSNTAAEIERKRREYFAGGTELVWVVEPELWTVDVWADPDTCSHLTIDDTLTGGEVLPGFELPIRKLAERATRGPGGHS